MSLFNSLLPSRPRVSTSTHELPLYNSPPTSPSAFPPPPVAASIHASSPFRAARTAATPMSFPKPQSEDTIILSRRQRQLEQLLQELLDAQSDALMNGAAPSSAASEDDVMSIESGTTKVQSPARSSVASPSRGRQTMSPGKARRGIYKAVRELAAIKEREEEIAKYETKDCLGVRKRLDNWNRKRTGLRKEINTIKSEDVGLRTRTLKAEADKLQDEITATEQNLARMRRRHRVLLEEITQLDNSVQSKLTSYVTSLNILDEEIQEFLNDPPVPEDQRSATAATFLSLSSSRRTLDMARDFWAEHNTSLAQRRKDIHREKRALDAGSALWKDCISRIEAFERHLRREMSKLDSTNSASSMASLLERMNEVISSVEKDLETAARERWNLLVACIGAELEAFKQGRAILEHAAGVVREQEEEPEDLFARDHDPLGVQEMQEPVFLSREDHEPPFVTREAQDMPYQDEDDEDEDGVQTVWNTPKASRVLRIDDGDDRDDEPDLELMVSKHVD